MHHPTTSKLSAALLRTVIASLSMAALIAVQPLHAADGHKGRHIVGTWYLALDAGPFDPALAGTYLSGIAQFHRDHTFMISDAGDFAADSFLPTLATPQYGAWRFAQMTAHSSRKFEGTALSLEAHKDTGEPLGWNKVHFSFELVGANRASGTINVYFLPCNVAPPLPTPLTCPDPVAKAGDFLPASPPDVPFSLTRVPVGE